MPADEPTPALMALTGPGAFASLVGVTCCFLLVRELGPYNQACTCHDGGSYFYKFENGGLDTCLGTSQYS